MADAVSKLYAEIGFKVNQDGLKQAQKIIKELAKQMSDINKATKEAAKNYGIFSKDQSKQALNEAKIATEASKQALNQKRIQIMGIKELQRQEDRDAREKRRKQREEETLKRKEERERKSKEKEAQREKEKAAKEQQKTEEKQAKEAEKAAKERKERLKNILGNFRSFAVGLRNTFLKITGVGGLGITAGVAQSIGRSIPTRDFMMATGVELGDLQQVMQRMVNTGSSLNQQQVMADIQKVSQNLRDIALGGGDLAPYKLAGVAATGDVMGVIRNVEKAVKNLDNATALNLTRRVGLSDEWLAMWRFKERYGGDQVQLSGRQQKEIEEASRSIKQLIYSFKLLSDQIAAVLSPVIKNFADLLRDSFQDFARYLKTHTEEIRESLKELSAKITDFIRKIDWEKIKDAFVNVGHALMNFAHFINYIASKFGIKEKEDKTGNVYEKGWLGTKVRKVDSKNDAVGRAITGSLSPTAQSQLGSFIGTPSRSAVFSAVDNHVNNVTINANTEDELIEKTKEAVEDSLSKDEGNILTKKLYGAGDLFVIAGTLGNASIGSSSLVGSGR